MENSLKGVLVVVTVMGLFITAILNYIILFPQEEGVSFNNAQDAQDYLTIQNTNLNTLSDLETVNNQSSASFDQWDVTTGFMGTNQLKQGQSGVNTNAGNIFTRIKIIATQLFSQNSPIVYALTIMAALATGYIIYLIVQFVRTGR